MRTDFEQPQHVGAAASHGLGPGQPITDCWREGGEEVGAGAVKPESEGLSGGLCLASRRAGVMSDWHLL